MAARSILGFDPNSYFNANPDLAAAGLTVSDARRHFDQFGYNELMAQPGTSRATGVTFGPASTTQYAGMDVTGFNPAAYFSANPDLKAAGLTESQARSHFDLYGYKELIAQPNNNTRATGVTFGTPATTPNQTTPSGTSTRPQAPTPAQQAPILEDAGPQAAAAQAARSILSGQTGRAQTILSDAGAPTDEEQLNERKGIRRKTLLGE